MILAGGAASKPSRCAVASRAWTRRLRPRGGSCEEDGEDLVAARQRWPASERARSTADIDRQFTSIIYSIDFTYSRDRTNGPISRGASKGSQTPAYPLGRLATAHRICAGERPLARLPRTCSDTLSVPGGQGTGRFHRLQAAD
jgi:hypothetical protein